MAEIASSPAPTGRKGRLKAWLKKNKLVVGLTGAAGLMWFIKQNGSGSGSPSIINEEGEVEGGANSIQLVPVSNAPNEENEENWQRIFERNAELEEERREREREEEQGGGGEQDPNPTPETETPELPEDPVPVDNPPGGITLHGKFFVGATGSQITGSGKLGQKKYVEYRIQFPGRVERWRYFPVSKNWQNVDNSANGPGKGGGGGQQGGGGKTGTPGPNAGTTDPKKVKQPPRKPTRGGTQIIVGPAKPTSGTVVICPAGTVQNIQHSRAEVQRLQGEINALTQQINQYPKAQARQGWINNRASKQALRDQFQGAVDRGRAQPGCGNV